MEIFVTSPPVPQVVGTMIKSAALWQRRSHIVEAVDALSPACQNLAISMTVPPPMAITRLHPVFFYILHDGFRHGVGGLADPVFFLI